jgi:iron complex outermembrane receptor protein
MPGTVHLRLVALILFGVSCAFAQSTASDPVVPLEPLIVTAQHRDQAIDTVPISLTAYSGTTLAALGITRFEDLAPIVPGLFISTQSNSSPSINLRGIGTDTTDPRQEARISIFQDGVAISRASGSSVELFDLERVEVLKGPQGTLFGRNAGAGAIALVSRRPTATRESALTLGLGDYSRTHAEGFTNLPLVGEQLLARIAFTTERRDGITQNLADGSDLSSRETTAVRASLRWLPQAATTVDLVLSGQRDTPAGINFKSGAIPPTRGDTDPYTAAEMNRGAALGLNRTLWGATLLVRHALTPAWSLDSTTACRQFQSHEELDGDGSRLFLIEASDDNRARQFSQEIRLSFDDQRRLAGFGGVNFSHEHGFEKVGVYTDERAAWPFLSGRFRNALLSSGLPAEVIAFAVPVLDPFAPQTNLPIGFAAFAAIPPLASLAALAGAPLQPFHDDYYRNISDFDAIDVFADGTWRATDRLEFTIGARASFERQTSGYDAAVSPVPSTLGFLLNAGPNFAVAPTPGLLTDTRHAVGWAGRALARYVFNPRVSAYAGISRGRRPPTTIITSTDSARNAEESIVNLEAGLKGSAWAGRLDWSAAVFTYRYRHFETLVIDPSNSVRFVLTDAGRAIGRGGELSLRAALAPTLHTFATYGYTDATFDAIGDNGQPQQYAGYTFRLTARHTAALGVAWEIPTSRFGRFTLAPRWEYKSGHFFEDNNALSGGTLHQSGFSLVHLRTSWRSPGGRWEAALSVRNLLDKKFLIDAGNIGAAFDIPTFNRGEPRLVTVDVTRRF